MNNNDILVIAISITFVISGYYINFRRSINRNEIVKTAGDNSLLIFRVLIPLALILSIVFYFLHIGEIFLPILVYLGSVLVVFGLLYRWYAVRSLGKYFRVKISLISKQKLITNGIYTNIRHPSYTGLLCYYLGLGLIMQNSCSLVLLIVFPLYVVLNRVRLEEIFLVENFGDSYKTYQKKSFRLIRFIY